MAAGWAQALGGGSVQVHGWYLDTRRPAESSVSRIGGGGILDGTDLRAFRAAGARAAMLYTAMVLRGPLAAALILREAEEEEPDA